MFVLSLLFGYTPFVNERERKKKVESFVVRNASPGLCTDNLNHVSSESGNVFDGGLLLDDSRKLRSESNLVGVNVQSNFFGFIRFDSYYVC